MIDWMIGWGARGLNTTLRYIRSPQNTFSHCELAPHAYHIAGPVTAYGLFCLLNALKF